jgi:hypothetical protein
LKEVQTQDKKSNSEGWKVVATILTYGNPGSISEVINAINIQSFPVERIIILDNFSTPENRRNFKKLYSGHHLITPTENLGVGAGHNKLWKEAISEYRPDYIWALEHDAIPEMDCLSILIENMSRCFSYDQSIAAAHPIEDNGLNFGEFKYYFFNSKGWQRVPNKLIKENYFGGLSFNGLLISPSSIQKYGYLDESFFIGMEDIEYWRRIQEKGGKILRVTSARVYHNVLRERKHLKIGDRVILIPNQSVLRDYYSLRNGIHLNREKMKGWSLIKKILLAFTFGLLVKDKPVKRFFAKLAGFRDGLRGNLGKMNYSFLK